MDESPEILKIEIDDEEDTLPQLSADGRTATLKERAAQAGKGAAQAVAGAATQAAQKGWDSEARKSVTGTVKKGAQKGVTAVAAKSADMVHEHLIKTAEEQARQQKAQLETRLRETDWKAEAGKGASATLRWTSQQIGRLAQRLAANTPPDDHQDNKPPVV
ncbi:MAG TPA: hypothetical protein PLD25_15400 [Chloroflexota bacterium]|nr:hypothetical protein [Chloroflexota bacterium]